MNRVICSHTSRRGNALVLALGVFALAAVLIGTAVEGSVVTSRQARASVSHQQALAALDAVLARRELMITERASQGDPVELARWSGNYGVDFIGSAEVRWKIEPVRTPPRDATGNPIYFITNPSPVTNWAVPATTPTDPNNGNAPFWESNDNNYLFRIAAEARVGVEDQFSGIVTNAAGQKVAVPAVVLQGARYASILQEPLFRYVIFYAARGSKGDLELSHADDVTIQGAVHTNGALYIGGGLKVNDEIGRLGALKGDFSPARTQIGPDIDNELVRVNGVDGIFRMNKPLMYTIINSFPRTNTSAPGVHGSPSDTNLLGGLTWDANQSYDLDSASFPTDSPGLILSSVMAATFEGRRINPYRIMSGDSSSPGSAAITENLFSGPDNLRTINRLPTETDPNKGVLRGVSVGGVTTGPQVANDSRDHTRPAGQKWTTLSLQSAAPGLDGKARSKLTGQNVKTLPERLRNRGFEAQRLEYQDCDGDDTTDEHEYARPLFVLANGATTSRYPVASAGFPEAGGQALVIEEPGQYLRYALGSTSSYMVRDPDGFGWSIRKRSNTLPDDPTTPGLIIRERPLPQVGYWPGTDAPTVVGPNDLRWLPYAYGKHFYPSNFKFTVADIAEEIAPTSARPWSAAWTGDTDPLSANKINTAANCRAVSYSPGGRLSITTAQRAAGSDGKTYTGWDDQYRRKPYFYAQNWRFVHLGQTTAAAPPTTGLRLSVFNDKATIPGSAVPSSSSSSLVADDQSLAADTALTSARQVTWALGGNLLAGITPSLNTQHRSLRFDGFITPTETSQYAFYVSSSSTAPSVPLAGWSGTADPVGYRMWVNGECVFSNWGMVRGEPSLNLARLSANQQVRVQIEVFNRASTPVLYLYWRKLEPLDPSYVQMPPAIFAPSTGSPGIARATFRAAQFRIDRPLAIAGPQAQKIGLMVRDGNGSISPLLNGSSPYGLVGYSPARGVFTERQRDRHVQDVRSASQFYIGAGVGPNGPSVAGQVIDNSQSVAVNRAATLTETNLTAVTQTNSGPNTWTSIDYGGATWSAPTSFSGTTSRDVGGGKIWTLLDSFSVGIRNGQRNATPQANTNVGINKYRVLTVTLGGHEAPFLDADHTRTLRIYNTANATGNYDVSGCDGDQIRNEAAYLGAASTPPQQNRWYYLGGLVDNRTILRRRFWNESWPMATTNGTTVSVTNTVGNANTIWYGGNIRINKNGTISNATLADINTVTGMSFTSANPTLPALNLVSPAYPAFPAAPAWPTVADPIIPDFTAGRTFSVQRLGINVTFDLNGWVTRSGSFFAPVSQFLPTAGPNWPLSWAGNAITTWPATGSFRPDVYIGAAAPAYTNLAVNPPANPNPVVVGSAQSAVNPWAMTDDISIPLTVGFPPVSTSEVWLRVESTTGNSLTFKYYSGITPPASAADFTTIPGTLDISAWGPSLLIGPAVQSGDVMTPTTVTLTNMQIETSLAAPDNVIDATDWDTDALGTDIMARYLASQYQVWWGPREITEDFFTWADTAGNRIATEDWIYNPREFWSQSRWWDHLAAGNTAVAKDNETAPNTTFNNTRLREALSKTTLLTLNLAALQTYLTTRRVSEAIADRITGANHDTALPAVAGGDDYVLRNRFSGLIYAVRTNRFPWNPNINPYLKDRLLAADPTANTSGINPWSPSQANRLPNSWADMGDTSPERGNDAEADNTDPAYSWLVGPGAVGHMLQPYPVADLPLDPPLKPQQFIHGVRMINGDSFHWGYSGTRTAGTPLRPIGSSGTSATDWTWSTTPKFGVGKTSVVTPNALYIQGNFNVDRHASDKGGDIEPRFTPVAVMGDSVTLLSNRFTLAEYQIPSLTVTNVVGDPSVTGVGTLACATLGAFASDTEYNTAIATHNQPSTRDRVAEGQSAPFVDTTLFIENWDGKQMSYLGSLVVMDSRRYTRAFLHGSYKTYGQTPFGIVSNPPANWLPIYNSFTYVRQSASGVSTVFKNGLYGPYWNNATPDWQGRSPVVYSEPRRVYQFNYDLLTEEGTPPFAPFGVSTSGVGGWVRIIK